MRSGDLILWQPRGPWLEKLGPTKCALVLLNTKNTLGETVTILSSDGAMITALSLLSYEIVQKYREE